MAEFMTAQEFPQESAQERYVRQTLERAHELQSRTNYKGDYDALIDLIDLADAIKKAELTDRQREALRLVYVEDMKQAEAALQMGVGQGTITNNISRAIKKIAKA